MKSYLAAALAIAVTACGGGGSSSSNDNVETTSAQSYSDAAEICQGAASVNAGEDALVFEDNQKYVVTPIASTDLVVKDSGSTVCVDGGLATIEALGDGHTIIVKDGVSELSVLGNGMTIAVFGHTSAISVTGANNKIYHSSVATIADTGAENAIMSISNFKAP